MDILKKIFPFSFKAKDVNSLIVSIVIYVVVGLASSLVFSLLNLVFGWIPIVGAILGVLFGIVGWVIGVYCLAGIVITLLDYFKVLK